MPEIKICPNCNASGDLVRLRVVFGTSDLGDSDLFNVYVPLDTYVCGSCSEAIAHLDLATWVERHESRPREMPLP